MSDLDIRRQLHEATQPAFTTPVDPYEDLARGRRARRRRRLRQAAAGTSAGAVAGAAVVAGVPLLGADSTGAAGPNGSEPISSAVASTSDGGPEATARRLSQAMWHHLGQGTNPIYLRVSLGPDVARLHGWISQAWNSEVSLLVRDDVRRGSEPVPLRCADDPAYDTCERHTLDDGTKVVIGQGTDDRLVAAWGRDGDLVEASAHVTDGGGPDVTIDQLIGLATDDGVWIERMDLPSTQTWSYDVSKNN